MFWGADPILSKVKSLPLYIIFPESLKIARVTPIFKGGDSDQPNCYRPISVISVISKLMEKLISKRLIKFLNKNKIVNDSQFRFRESHSTTHAITNINETILRNVELKKHTASIYLDLSKAFDCVNHKILLEKLYTYGVRGISHKLFQSYLTDRYQFTSINGSASVLLKIICGVHKASPLVPCYF